MNQWIYSMLLCVVMLAGWSLNKAFAQPPNVIFDHLSVKDGLPSSDVYSIARDRQGFMWFGTRRCPVRYDGDVFRSFLFTENIKIKGKAADTANRMWVATDRRGVASIEPNTLQLIPLKGTQGSTSSLFIDAAGRGWFGDSTGINRIDYKAKKIRHYSFRQTSYRGPKAHGFLEDKQHNLWVIGSDNGLFRYDRNRDRFVCVLGLDCTDPHRRFQCYLSQGSVDTNGILWIGTYGQGLLRVDPSTNKFKLLKMPNLQNWVTCVQEGTDENGRRILWLGDPQGLLVYRPEQQRFFRLPAILSASFYTHTLYRDAANGIVWVGTSDGVLKYNPQDNLIHTVRIPPTVVQQPVQVNVITADHRDTTGQTFWLGLSHTGLLHWYRPTNQFTLIRYPTARAETMWIDQPGNGQLWVGLRRWDYQGDGVLVYNPKFHCFVNNPAAKRAGTLFSVPFVDHGLIDKWHRLWVGNNDEGVRILDSRTGQILTYWSDSVIRTLHRNNNFLTDLKCDRLGRVWLGTYNGLYYVEEVTHRFIPADSQSAKIRLTGNVEINSLLTARNGHIWAARWGSITESRPDGKLLTVLTARNGLFDRENRQLAEDGTGTIWIGNYEGLHAYRPQTHRLLRLTVSDGLTRNNTTACLYVQNGNELFIGQMNGLNYVDITQLQHRAPMPPVVISSFRVHEQERPFNPRRLIRLARSDNAFSVDFTTLTYNRLSNSQYAYFLENLDDQWNYSGTTHRAHYTNLSPGTYRLHLKAADSFGHWTNQPLTLSIVVLPAYYETWWFRGLVVLLIGGFLYSLYRYRINQLLRLERIRNRISSDLHDEIGSSLSGIGILGAMIKQTLPSGHPTGSLVERINSEARQMSSSLDDIVWSINPRNDDLSSLIARMNRYAAELFEASGITYEISIPDTLQHLTLSMEKRQNLYLIMKEAVNNLVKHARATHAHLTVRREHSSIHLLISDNGVGFDPTGETLRNGLRNMHTRAQFLHGDLTINSTPGQGTTLHLSFPVSV